MCSLCLLRLSTFCTVRLELPIFSTQLIPPSLKSWPSDAYDGTKACNQDTGYASQHIWCLSQARINWQGCSKRGIQRKNGGMRQVGQWLIRMEWRLSALSVCLPWYLHLHQKVQKRAIKWLCVCVCGTKVYITHTCFHLDVAKKCLQQLFVSDVLASLACCYMGEPVQISTTGIV